jgi:hypothetical protein
MTRSVTTITSQQDSAQAGAELGRAIREGLNGGSADAVVVFASAQHDYHRLLSALVETSGTEVVVGSSSAGEFTNTSHGEGYVSARNLTANPTAAAQQVVETFAGLAGRPMPYRSALVMTDALAGHTDALVEEMTIATGGNYRFFGGGAGDDGRFQKTYVFAGTQAMSDAVVALEMLSMQPVGVGVSHGWTPAGPGLRVTEVDGSRLISLNGAPALQAFEDHAEATRQKLDQENPLPFFLHNILGIESNGSFRLRVPLGIGADGSVSCAAAVPHGAVVRIMKTTAESAILAAEQATRSALEALGGREPGAALVFDCVATRLRIGSAFDNELKACADLLGPAGFVGCNTYGQIARAEGQFGGFHNCTAVVCVLPQ